MKVLFKIVFALSGILPATYLMFWLVFILVMILTNGLFTIDGLIAVGLILLAITGYIGLILVLFEETVNNEMIIAFLLAGVLSFIISTSISGNWSQAFSPKGASFYLFTWPTIVAIINIVWLILKPNDQQMKSSEVD